MSTDAEQPAGGDHREMIPQNSISSRIVDQADLTALVIRDAIVRGASAQQALFSGTLFRNCTFHGCNFRRADFEGAVFENCTFEDCDFGVADFRSVDAARSAFIRCGFEEGSIRSCTLSECRFEHCRLTGHSFTDNRLNDCVLDHCSFQRSTLLHCIFKHTVFRSTDLSDCTSQYHLFSECSFSDSSINAESIGLTYGLQRGDLVDLKLVWRGIDLPRPDGGHTPEVLVSTYSARGWIFSAAIIKLNFGIGTPLEIFGEIFSTIRDAFATSMPIRADELRFLATIIDHLSKGDGLPFLAIAAGLDVVAICSERDEERNARSLKPLFHALKEAEHFALQSLDDAISPLIDADQSERTLVCFRFSQRPLHSFDQWLGELHDAGLISGARPQFRNSAQGSHLEFFYMAAGSLAGLLICLSLVERIIDKLVWIRARGQILASKTLPPIVRRRALQPVAAASPALMKELKFALDFARGPAGKRLISDAQDFGHLLTNVEVARESD